MCLILIPIAVNIAMIISADSGSTMIQQTMPMAVLLPFFASTINLEPSHKMKWSVLARGCPVILSAFLIGSFLMISIDQQTMLTSRNNSISLLNRIASDLDYSEEPVDGYVFIGKISDNPLYRKDDLWWRANGYARYGDFFVGTNGNTQSYNGLLRDAGLNLKLNWNDGYWHELEAREDIEKMSVYPYEGYAFSTGNVTVIKVSEY